MVCQTSVLKLDGIVLGKVLGTLRPGREGNTLNGWAWFFKGCARLSTSDDGAAETWRNPNALPAQTRGSVMAVGRRISLISTEHRSGVYALYPSTQYISTLEGLELTATCMQRPCCRDIGVKASGAPEKDIKICLICAMNVCQAWDLAWLLVFHLAGGHLKPDTCMHMGNHCLATRRLRPFYAASGGCL